MPDPMQLAADYLYVVPWVMRRMGLSGAESFDPWYAGLDGLLAAARRYDGRARFFRFAVRHIRWSILGAIKTHANRHRILDRLRDERRRAGRERPDAVGVVNELLAELGDTPRELIRLRYGLDGGGERSGEQIAAERGVSGSAVTRHLRGGLGKMAARLGVSA